MNLFDFINKNDYHQYIKKCFIGDEEFKDGDYAIMMDCLEANVACKACATVVPSNIHIDANQIENSDYNKEQNLYFVEIYYMHDEKDGEDKYITFFFQPNGEFVKYSM